MIEWLYFARVKDTTAFKNRSRMFLHVICEREDNACGGHFNSFESVKTSRGFSMGVILLVTIRVASSKRLSVRFCYESINVVLDYSLLCESRDPRLIESRIL
jgi:hypothetical protein